MYVYLHILHMPHRPVPQTDASAMKQRASNWQLNPFQLGIKNPTSKSSALSLYPLSVQVVKHA